MIFKLMYLAHLLACFWHGGDRLVHYMYYIHYMHTMYYPSPSPAVALIGQAEGLTTWTMTYDDGTAAEDGTNTKVKYLYSLYWALTTLTTVGYGDSAEPKLQPNPAQPRVHPYDSVGSLLGSLLGSFDAPQPHPTQSHPI